MYSNISIKNKIESENLLSFYLATAEIYYPFF